MAKKAPACLRHSTSNEASLRMHLRRTSCTPHEAHVVAPLLIDYCVEQGLPDPYAISAKEVRKLIRTDVLFVPPSLEDRVVEPTPVTNFYGNTGGTDAYYAEQRRINLDRRELEYAVAETDQTVDAEEFDTLTRDIEALRVAVAADEYAADLRFSESRARTASRTADLSPQALKSTVRASRAPSGTGTPRTTFSHAHCAHAATPKDRAACRKLRRDQGL